MSETSILPKVSVIIPVYKVKTFIARNARSLMEQTLRDVEFFFVDDCSPDDSIAELEKELLRYPHRQKQVSILHHEINKGLPAARNTGLLVAKGEYIFHCDSDDYLETDALERMYEAAIQNEADIVWTDWYLSFESTERYMKQPSYVTAFEALKAMLCGAMKYNVWNKLVKRSLYTEHQIYFPTGYGMGEDMTMMLLFAFAKKVYYLPCATYHYVKLNTDSFSRTYSDRHLAELRHNVVRTERFLREVYGADLEKEISFMKLEAKFPLLLSNDPQKMRMWHAWYPDANKYILCNHSISVRSRFIQWCAAKRLMWVVRCYQWFFDKIVYGVIYK